MLTIGGAFHHLRTSLLKQYDDTEATAIAHIVLETLTGLGRLQRLTEKMRALEPAPAARFHEIEAGLLAGRPLQYVLGEAPFLGRMFRVDENVLIPRPETEELAAWIIADGPWSSVLDIGTGSGCIAISLKLGMQEAAVSALDFSAGALRVAAENARRLGADVAFMRQDFLNESLRAELSRYEVIVSNPPYIPASMRDGLDAHVREHEPGSALFVPDAEPLLFYKAIAAFGEGHLTPGGSIYCELHRDHAIETAEMFRAAGYKEVILREDIYGAPRMLRARL